MGEDRIKWDSQQKQFINQRGCCSNCALIRRVIKKKDAPHYRIDVNYNLRYYSNFLLNTCSGNTTVRRKILIKLNNRIDQIGPD